MTDVKPSSHSSKAYKSLGMKEQNSQENLE